jgi:hypothetical protein
MRRLYFVALGLVVVIVLAVVVGATLFATQATTRARGSGPAPRLESHVNPSLVSAAPVVINYVNQQRRDTEAAALQNWYQTAAQQEAAAHTAVRVATPRAQPVPRKPVATNIKLTVKPSTKPTTTPVASGCGGNLPPCSVMMCESGGNPTAQNPRSTASGTWQILDSTWNGYGGYSRAMYAPVEVQNAKAAELYAGGAGRSQWVC